MAQLKEFMGASQRKVLEEQYKEFASVFNAGVYMDEEFQQIHTISNQMLQKGVNASQFGLYLKGLQLVKSDPAAGGQRFKEWHVILFELVSNMEGRKTKPLNDFLNFSKYFFEENMLRYSKTGTDWLITAGQYQMRFEEDMPVFHFQKTSLMATYKKDSIQILDTQGKYYPTLNTWKGSGGRVTWDRFNLDEKVFAEFPEEYEIEMNTSLYRVNNVKLQYPSYFGNKKIVGNFQDKLVSSNASTEASYPRFESKENVLKISNIGRGIEYLGGFRLHGTTVYGYGADEGFAEVRIRDEAGGLKFKGKSELVIIKRGEYLTGEHVEATLYNGIDSIYHPSVNIRFHIPSKELRMRRGKEGRDRNPFYSSAHDISINVEHLNAYLEQDSLVIGQNVVVTTAASNTRRATFESGNYFDENDYERIQNLSNANPVAIIAATATKENTKELDAESIAKRINPRYTEENIQSLLFDLMERGFVAYDDKTKTIDVKEKVFHYANASQRRVDFDGLRIESQTDSINATLNWKTNKITMGGIPYIEFSPRQRVALKPNEGTVVMGENRDMEFDGRLFAGFSRMEGKGFKFDYDRFHIELDSVDYFDIFVPTGKMLGKNRPEAISIGSRIENLNGVLLIDAPSNKSGSEDIEIFPSFQSKEHSYVYYDDKEIFNGVYKRDSFYFELDKFSFNKLDKLTLRDIKFDGILHSSDIFPTFRDELIVRPPDQSLGFTHEIPGDNYPMYVDKGWYKGEIDLSNRGLLGKGEIEYLSAKIQSEDIIFKPKQLTATARAFNIEEDRTGAVPWPQATGVDVSIDWQPYQDSMYVRTKEELFSLYQSGEHTVDGTLVLSPGGLKGIGTLDWSKATMNSPLFSFGAFSAEADTTNLTIKASEDEEIALRTKNVNGKVDFDTEQANFKANDEFLVTELPYNQYETSMNEFEWNMKEEKVQFKTEPNTLGAFLSVHPDQDSLTFKGDDALYDLSSNELAIKGVPFIRSADAYIYPDSGLVFIRPNAVMDTLYNSKIVANVVNKNHVINRATVKILGNREYYASGFYEYNIGDKQQEVEFSDIQGKPVGKGALSKKESITRARGTIAPEDTFYIDLKTEFQGDISLSAESKALFFDGFARLEAPKLPRQDWFRIRCEGDKEDLAIRYETPKTPDAEPLRTGIFLSKETARAYPSIMAPLYFRKDRALLPVTGYMKYDREKDYFIFADSVKTVRPDAPKGNKLVFKNRTGKVEAEGKFDLCSGAKYIDVEAAGTLETAMPIQGDSTAFMDYKIEAQFMAAVDLIVPDKLMTIMIKDLQSAAIESRPVNYLADVDFYRKTLSELFPLGKDVNNAITGLSSGTLELPAKVNKHTFLFSNLPMKWDPDYQSFVTSGSRIGLASIKGELFNYSYKGYVEFKMPTNEDDRVYIYLETPSGNFYYFGFKAGILNMTSNNEDYLKAFDGLKAKELVKKMKDGETYEIQLVPETIARTFVSRAKAAQ